MRKIKIIIISVLLFVIVFIISDFLLKKIPSIYYDCFSTFPEAGHDICMVSRLGLAIPLILGLGIAAWYFYRSLSFIKSNQNVKN